MRLLFSIFMVGLLFSGCQQKDTGTCSDEVCTTDFVMLNVLLLDSVGNNFIADKVETYKEGGTLIHQSNSVAMPNTSYYTLVDDSNINSIPGFSFTKVYLNVLKNNSIVKTDTFIVSSNCCHVFKQAGVDTVIVQ